MKTILLFISLFSFVAIQARNDIVIKQNVQSLVQHGGSEGKEFFVAFPLNDYKDHRQQNLAIYVTSRFETDVTLSNESLGISVTKTVKLNETTEISIEEEDFDWDAEILNFEKVIEKGLYISSKDPVKIYVLNSKSATSEGYMAVPVRKWGTEYIHNSFYDFKEQPDPRDWGGGFVVLASEDETEVKINLVDGVNKSKGFGQTINGRQHGDSIIVTLNRGEVYTVQGDGRTRGVFDLSGSQISSDKPIGLISYHNRTMIPTSAVFNGRDHLSEMMPPVSSWGTEYHSVELDRQKNKGDFYRIVAGEDNVTFNVTWYDKYTKSSLGHFGPITLKKKGDWFEYNNYGVRAPHAEESIRGVAHFRSGKPMMVVQYSYSAEYDGADGNWDPFMSVLPSVDQYTNDCIFQTPRSYSNNIFKYNFINLIAEGDTSNADNNKKLIESVEFNKESVVTRYPEFVTNNIPGTNYFWVRIFTHLSGPFRITSDTKFGATMYGYAGFDSYSWPVTQNTEDLVNIDDTSPNVEVISKNYKYIFKVSDEPTSTGGLNSLPQLMSGSNNFTEPKLVDKSGNELATPEWFNQKEYYFSVELEDYTKNSSGFIKVLDKNYNQTDIAIYYSPEFKSHIEGEAVSKRNIFTRVGTKTKGEYLELFNKPRHDINPSDAPPITIKISEINTLNSDVHFKYAEGEVIRGYNKNDEIVLEEKDLDSVVIFNQSVESLNRTTKIELPIYFEPDTICYCQEYLTIPYVLTKERYESTNSISVLGESYAPEIQVNNFTFEPLKINSGVSKQKGKLRLTSPLLTVGFPAKYNPSINIKSIYLDPNSLDKELFSSIKIYKYDDEFIPPINWVTGVPLDIEFELNTDMATTTGTKFARLVVESDAAPADENGNVQFVENSYLHEFDGEFYKDNPTALEDGGYIQVEILENTQSSVAELTDKEIKILNPQPISGSELNLEISEHHGAIITLSDIEGNVIQSLQADRKQVSIDVSGLTNGVYFINISNGKSNKTKKFILKR